MKQIYACGECGNESPKWEGKCAFCGAWGTLKEYSVETTKQGKKAKLEFVDMDANLVLDDERQATGLGELDLVLGGGLVEGGVLLLSGEPGAGKSTLMMQLAINLTRMGRKVVYVSGEESVNQVGLRYRRLGGDGKGLRMVATGDVVSLLSSLRGEGSDLLFIDSIQTMDSGSGIGAIGGLSQVRDSSHRLIKYAKENGVSLVISGHITKDGIIAGPKILEHMVDIVLYIENSNDPNMRFLRCTKNRYGDVGNVGVLRMGENGYSDAEPLVGIGKKKAVGVCRSVLIEGRRPMLVSVQALVGSTQFSLPKRVVSGINTNRAHLMVGILNKYLRLDFGNKDIYLNLSSGIRTSDVALDLAVCVALYSAYKNIEVNLDKIYFGEVGLDGEVVIPGNFEHRNNEINKYEEFSYFADNISKKANKEHYRVEDILKNL